MPRIYISASTQERNVGISPFTTEEAEMNLIADELIPLLAKDGRFTVKRNNPSWDPYQCAADSNKFLANIHIALHSNAGGGVGTEVFTFGPNTDSEKLGKALYNQIAPLSPGADRGVKYNPKLVEVGSTVWATSCLIEIAFHDNKLDAEWMVNNRKVIAQALYRGVLSYYGYDSVPEPVVVPPSPIVAPVDYDIYLSVRCYKSKADQAIKDINKLGFACKILPLA